VNTFLSLIAVLGFLILCLSISKYFYRKVSLEYVDKFNSYLAVLQFHEEKAYDMIHKDRILIFSLEATKPSEDEVTSAAKDFSKLVLRFIGPRLERDLMYVYGDKETLILNLIDYFNTRFETDEIRQNQVDDMINKNNTFNSAETTLSNLLNKRK